MEVSMVASGKNEDCGINTYTTALGSELKFEVENLTRIGLKSHSKDIFHYFKKGLATANSDADIIHIQHEYGIFGPKSIGSWFFILPLLICKLVYGKKTIITMHNSWNADTAGSPFRSLKIAYIKMNNILISKLADEIIFLTEDCADDFAVSVPSSEPTIIKHGVPTSNVNLTKTQARNIFEIDNEQKLIVEPGYVRRAKGHHLLTHAAKKMPDYEFLIAGGPRTKSTEPYLKELEAKAPGNVTVTGVLEDRDFQAAFIAADLCFLPYLKASQSGIVNWAVRYNLPILASQIDYFEELESNNEFIRTIDLEKDSIPKSISYLFQNKSILEDMRKSAKEYYKKNNMSEIAKEHRYIYENVNGKKSSKQTEKRI